MYILLNESHDLTSSEVVILNQEISQLLTLYKSKLAATYTKLLMVLALKYSSIETSDLGDALLSVMIPEP